MKPNPYIHIRRIIVDPPKRPEADPNTSYTTHLPITRAEPEPVGLTPKQARRAERRAARQRIATPPPPPPPGPTPPPTPAAPPSPNGSTPKPTWMAAARRSR